MNSTGQSVFRLRLAPGWLSDGTDLLPIRTWLSTAWETSILDAAAVLAMDNSIGASRSTRSAPCCWLGWSLGALCCLQAALRHPDGVQAMVLLGATACLAPPMRSSPEPAPSRRVIRAMRQRLRCDLRGTASDFFRLCVRPGDADDDWLSARLAAASRMDPSVLAAGLARLEQTDLRADVGRVSTPVLLLHGACDAVVPCAQSRDLASVLPWAERHVFPETGHLPTSAMLAFAADWLHRTVGGDPIDGWRERGPGRAGPDRSNA